MKVSLDSADERAKVGIVNSYHERSNTGCTNTNKDTTRFFAMILMLWYMQSPRQGVWSGQKALPCWIPNLLLLSVTPLILSHQRRRPSLPMPTLIPIDLIDWLLHHP